MPDAFVTPRMITWARERYSLSVDDAAARTKISVSKWRDWESGHAHPSLVQAQKLASSFHVPLGYLFLDAPPSEDLPLPDLRTVSQQEQAELSPDFYDLINDVLRKQDWYREYLQAEDASPVQFVAKYSSDDSPDLIAQDIRETIGINEDLRRDSHTYVAYLRNLTLHAESARILVMRSGVVEGNTHRPLKVQEFRGFAVSDPLAPLIFVNSKDAWSAQIFTFVHELAHLWTGVSGISSPEPQESANGAHVELLSNNVAAEVLVPRQAFMGEWHSQEPIDSNIGRMALAFKVSTLVILRRAYDLDIITDRSVYWEHVNSERDKQTRAGGGGGTYWPTLFNRVGRPLATAALSAAAEGRITFRSAAELLNIKKMSTLNEASVKLFGQRLFP